MRVGIEYQWNPDNKGWRESPKSIWKLITQITIEFWMVVNRENNSVSPLKEADEQGKTIYKDYKERKLRDSY